MFKYKYIILVLLNFMCLSAFASESDVDVSISPAYDGVSAFVLLGSSWLEDIQTSADAAWYFNAVLLSTIVIKSVSSLTLFIFKKTNLDDLFLAFFMIILTFSFFHSFGSATEAVYGWTQGIIGLIQKELLGTDEALYTSNLMAEIAKRLVLEDYNPLSNFIGAVKMSILALLMALFEIALLFINSWVVIGVVLSQLLGIFMIPFLLFKPTQFIFDGWVKMFLGFLAYGLVGKVIAIIVIQIILEFFGISAADLAGNAVFQVSLTSTGTQSWLALIGIFFVGIFMLFSTASIASSFVGGVSGLGGAINGAARAAISAKSMGFKGG